MNSTVPIRHGREIDIFAVVRVLWSLKYVVIVPAVLLGAASVYLALTATPVYRAEVVVVKADETGMSAAASLAGQLGGLVGVNLDRGGPGIEAQAVLESRNLVEEFIERNGILGELVSGDGEPPTLWDAVERFRQRVLTIREDTVTGITTISVDWTDPAIAASWANAFVALANDLIRNRDREESERNIEYLKEQIEQTTVVALQGVMYNLIESETKTVMLANARAEYAFTVVDPAVAPEVRIRPNRKMIVLSGGALGFVLGVLAALAFNFFRQIRSRKQVA